MKERAITFNTEMIQALLLGRKTMMRKIAKVNDSGCKPGFITPNSGHVPRPIEDHTSYCPYGIVGDRLWVKETWQPGPRKKIPFRYKADGGFGPHLGPWKSPYFMPRKAARIILEITNIKIERVREISEEDVRREGIEVVGYGDYPSQFSGIHLFEKLWNSLHKKDGFDLAANPWCWAITFKRIK